jgi:hypothetical protein
MHNTSTHGTKQPSVSPTSSVFSGSLPIINLMNDECDSDRVKTANTHISQFEPSRVPLNEKSFRLATCTKWALFETRFLGLRLIIEFIHTENKLFFVKEYRQHEVITISRPQKYFFS